MQVQNGLAHASANHYDPSHEKLRATDYGPFTYLYTTWLIARLPQPVSRYDSLIVNFQYQVWAGTVLVIVGFCLILVVINKLLDQKKEDIFVLFMLSYGLMINESVDDRFTSIKTHYSNQLLLTTWMLPATLIGIRMLI